MKPSPRPPDHLPGWYTATVLIVVQYVLWLVATGVPEWVHTLIRWIGGIAALGTIIVAVLGVAGLVLTLFNCRRGP